MSVSMLAALLQAVVDRVETDVMAIGARVDALVFLRPLVFVDVSHCFASFLVGVVVVEISTGLLVPSLLRVTRRNC